MFTCTLLTTAALLCIGRIIILSFFQFKLNAFVSASRVLSCVNALNNGEIFLLRGFAEKLLGPSLYRFLAALSQPVQVSATG